MQEQNLFVNSEPVEDIALRDCDHCYDDYDISVWNGPCAWVPTCPENDCGCAWPPPRTCPPCAYEAPYEPFDADVPCVPPAPCPCESCDTCADCQDCQPPEPPTPCEEDPVPYCAVCDAAGAENIVFDVPELPVPVVPEKQTATKPQSHRHTARVEPPVETPEPTEPETPETAQAPDAAPQGDYDSVLSALPDAEMPALFTPAEPQASKIVESCVEGEETMFFPVPTQAEAEIELPEPDAAQQEPPAAAQAVPEQAQPMDAPYPGDVLPYEDEIVQL